MKNIFILSILTSVFIFSCQGPTPEPGSEPIVQPDGKLDIKFTDIRIENSNPRTITLSNNDVIAVSYNIKKGADGSRPVKMSVYVTENNEARGILLLDNIKLKEIDEQIRTLEVSLPAVGINVFRDFYITVTDNKGKISLKNVSIIPTGAEQITSWSNISLGVQGSILNSRFSSASGDVYNVCDLDSNINLVDITYATIGSPSIRPTFLSNPRRGALGLPTTASDKICINVAASGGTPTFFAPINVPIEFGTVNDLFLKGLAIPNTTQDLVIEAGKIYMFQSKRTTRNGKSVIRKGVIKINSVANSITSTGQVITSGVVNFDVKVQR